MSKLPAPTPIYDALLTLATPSEREAIIEGGEAAWLSPNLRYGNQRDRARRAYEAIGAIVERVIDDVSLKVTGIDTRQIPARRAEIDSALLRSGHLRWVDNGTVDSQLQFDWGGDDLIKITALLVEPDVVATTTTNFIMKRSPNLNGRERKDDTARLLRMQQMIDSGMQPGTAAARVAAELPVKGTSDDSLIRRLTRKFKQRQDI